MVHKKYIRRGNKVFGPYLYENYRENGVTKTRYLGKASKKEKNHLRVNRNLLIILGVSLFLIAIFISYPIFYRGLTAGAILEIAPSYSLGEKIYGNLNLVLEKGELIPADSVIRVKLGEQEKSIALSELIENEQVEGNFYAKNLELEGKGKGYGFYGTKKIYPEISFTLLIQKKIPAEKEGVGGEVKKSEKSEEKQKEEQEQKEKEVKNKKEKEQKQEEVKEEETKETEEIEEGGGGVEEVKEKSKDEEGEAKEVTKHEEKAEKEEEEEEKEEPTEQETEKGTQTKQETVTEIEEQEQAMPEQITEQPETIKEITQELTIESETTSEPQIEQESQLITGSVIKEQQIQGKVTAKKPFTLQLQEGEEAKIIPGSIKINGEKVSDDLITLQQEGNKVIISTEYVEEEKGFGSDYVVDEKEAITINLEKLDLIAEPGTLEVCLEYHGLKIIEAKEKISVEKVEEPEISENITEEVELNITTNITLPENITTNITLPENITTNITITTLQYEAVINQPVKWKKNVKLDNPGKIKIKLPKSAENITVYVTEEEKAEKAEEVKDKEDEEVEEKIGEITEEKKEVKENFEKVKKRRKVSGEKIKLNKKAISGKIIAEVQETEELAIIRFFRKVFSKLTGKAIVTEEIPEEAIEVVIEENASEYDIEYYTPGPQAFEQKTERGKKIIIRGPEDIHYENVLAYTFLTREAPEENIKLFWLIEENYTIESNETNKTITGTKVVREEVSTQKYDLNNNSLIDYVEWIVPHLSEQVYEIELSILNVYSQPQVGREWMVYFDTFGTADLIIKVGYDQNYSEDITTWVNNESDIKNDTDLLFLDVRCGNQSLDYLWVNNSILIKNYSCNGTGIETSKVLTEGKHVLEFDFGGIKAYAYNNATYNLTQGLVLWYHFNNDSAYGENDTFVYDFSGNGNNGTAYEGAIPTDSGLFDGAYSFNGKAGYVETSIESAFDNVPLTVVAWIKAGSSSDSQAIFARYGMANRQFKLILMTGRTLRLTTSKSGSIGDSYFTDGDIQLEENNWYFVCAVVRPFQEIYVNGVLDESNSYSVISSSDKPIRIGDDENNQPFNGTIDEVMVYNRVLSPQEIQLLYLFGAEAVPGAEICDVGTADTTCYLNHTYYFKDGEIIGANNLVIQDNGSIANYTGGASLTLNLGGNLTILSGGNISGGNISIHANNVEIEAGGMIYTTGLGYVTGKGPGAGALGDYGDGAGGAGYGGRGGDGESGYSGGEAYGSYKEPVDFGSGGGNSTAWRPGGNGGGIVKINATIIEIQGEIKADGGAPPILTGGSYAGGGSSGGSIWLIADNITGTGNITANGGDGVDSSSADGGGGSGGRIAIYAISDTFTGQITTYGGSGGHSYSAAAGTIYKKLSSQQYGDLIIDNNNLIKAAHERQIGARLHSGIHTFDNITLRNKGNLEIHNSSIELNLTSTNVIGDGDLDSRITISGNVTLAPAYTITNWTLALNNGSNVKNLQNLTIGDGGILTHSPNYDTKTYWLDLSLNKLTILAGGSVNVSGMGYYPGQGPGTGSGDRRGGSYGGKGGDSIDYGTSGPTYGSYLEPTDLGSGGYSSGGLGGGAVKINASIIEIIGRIISNGASTTTPYAGGGSGGSIWLIANNITGTGNISANGGDADIGGGGGGRIAIYATLDTFTGQITAYGGGNYRAAPGTIYKKLSSQQYGDLIIDNNDKFIDAAHERQAGARLHSGIHTFDNITIRNKGNLEIHNSSIELNLTSTNVIGDGDIDSRITISGNVTITPNFTITNWTLALNNGSNVRNLQNLTIGAGGILTHSPNYNNKTYWLDLSLTKLTILAGGSVNVSGMGYYKTQGPGAGVAGGYGNGSGGAGYGGQGGMGGGGKDGGSAYGSYLEPTDLGSGARSYAQGGLGGGAVKINATIIEIYGNIDTKGRDGAEAYGAAGGSGGSIWLIADNITGTGNISVGGGNGRSGGTTGGGGGSGGRIHIQAKNLTLSGIISNQGGRGSGYGEPGQNGTIVIEFAENIDLTGATLLTPVVIARNSSYGRIVYNLNLVNNESTDESQTDQTTNTTLVSLADDWIIISQNNVTVYSENNPELNRSAMIWLWNVTGINEPEVKRNGITCPVSICGWNNNTSPDFWFNVTGFTEYSIGETVYPEIEFVSPTEPNGANVSQNWIFVNVSVTELYPSNITYYLYNSTVDNINTTTLLMADSNSNTTFNFTNIEDGTYYYNVTIIDDAGNSNSTETRQITLDTTPPNITIIYPSNQTTHYSAIIDFNVSVSDNMFDVESCLYSLDSESNVSMTKLNETFFNYTYTGISYGLHNLTISCNDSVNNWNSVTEYNFDIVLLDLIIVNVTVPSPIYTNSTLIIINVSNLGPPDATNINITCNFNNTSQNSSLISFIAGQSSYITNCTITPSWGKNQILNVTVDPENILPESNESNNVYLVYGINTTQIAEIRIITASETNTTDTINVRGLMIGNDGTILGNKLFTIKLNNVTVSSDTYNDTNFTAGTGNNINISSVINLNLSSESNVSSYEDDYSTTKYQQDSYNYISEGYYAPGGYLFSLNEMTDSIGNITYKFNSVTEFYNATAYITTATTADPGGNTSIWYSLDNSTWNILASSTTQGSTIGGSLPVKGREEFYIRIISDTHNFANENPVTRLEVNYTNYNYAPSGYFISRNITLPNITYTLLRWTENLNGGNIKIQLRESDDGISWSSWSENYTNCLNNDISSFTKPYLQYRAWLSTNNLSKTPTLYDVRILYFNASTNFTGGYSYNITIPTDNLGSLPLEVAVSPGQDIYGTNQTYIDVWARTSLPYSVEKNYSGFNSNYSVFANFTRSDLGSLINGSINITISNLSMARSQTCSGETCIVSWTIPSDLAYGNYTINITAYNETEYFRNASIGFIDYLEEKNTTGKIYTDNKTIPDFAAGNNYTYYWNVTINNTGRASMNNIHVWAAAYDSDIQNIVEITPCSRLYPHGLCNALMMVIIDGGASAGDKYITWRANWTDNDGSIAGGANYVQYVSYVTITLNATLGISNKSINLTLQHGTSGKFIFQAQSVGTDSITNINISYNPENMPASWLNITPNWIGGLAPGQSEDVEVNISVPLQTSPGNYSGMINVSSSNGGEELLNLSISVPLNASWYFIPSTNLTYNNSFSLNTAGEIGNFSIINTGNINITFNISYTSGRTTDYTIYPGLFSVDTDGRNPTLVNVSKGENTTITIWQSGWDGPLNDVGVVIRFYNETAVPTTRIIEESFTIVEQPPSVSDIWFYVDNEVTNTAEINKNITIKVRATDDIGLNLTETRINITHDTTEVVLNVTDLCSIFGECTGSTTKRTVANFTSNFTPTFSGLHYVKAIVYDQGGKSALSSTYNFTVYGTTNVELSQNFSSINISTINRDNKAVIYLNYTLNNTGNVYAYSPVINFTKNGSIIIINQTFDDIIYKSKKSKVVEINISALTSPGQYNVTATLTWRNPDNSYNTDSIILEINVLSNKSFVSTGFLNYTVSAGSSNSSLLEINNTGNDLLSGISLSCYEGSLCSIFTVSFNESNFNIPKNSSRSVNVTVSAPLGIAAGTYNGSINISEQNISKTLNIYAKVPETLTWSASPLSINATKAVSSAGNLQAVTIENTGNVNLTLGISSSNISLIQTNVSEIIVEMNTSGSFMVNYTTPSTESSYLVKISITNASASPQQLNVSVNLTATRLNVTILSPRADSPLQNLTAGQNISIITNLTYSNEVITNNTNWSIFINESSCTNISYFYDSLHGFWNISCITPDIDDGKAYDLKATAIHTTFGEVSFTETNAVEYRDVTAPRFNVTRNNINLGQNINLSVNVTDNVNVGTVKAYITYPNATTVNYTLSLVNGLYNLSFFNLDLPGEYIVNYTANDSTGNFNSTIDWFEVYDRYFWILKLVNYNLQPVSSINITLYRPNTTTILVNNLTDINGLTYLYVNKRFYDLKAEISLDEVIVRNINFTNLSTSNISFNLHRMNGEDLSETIALYEPFIGIASNSSGLSSNEVNIIFNYTGYDYDNANELRIIKCGNWNYTDMSCLGSWTTITSLRDIEQKKVQGNSTGFSCYFLAENKCGNGLCETTYGETTSTCSADCKETEVSISVGGGGGGGGGVSRKDLESLKKLIKGYLEIGGMRLETTSIYKELFAGETTTVRIKLSNTLNNKNTISLSAEGDVKQFIFFEKSSIELEPNEIRDVLIKIVAPKKIEPGNYDGDLVLKSGEEEGRIPVTIRILHPEGKLLDVKIQPLTPTVAPGEILRLQTDLLNLGKTKKVDVQFDLQLLDVETGEIINRQEEAFAVETTISTVKELRIPEEIKPGRYMVKATAYYSAIEGTMQASSIAYIRVAYPFFKRKLFGIPLLIYLLIVMIIAVIIGGLFYVRYLEYRKKRFKVKVDMSKLPQAGPNSAFIGKIAETGIRTFLDLNKLQMHTLVAGATGSGKTIAAQDIIEEALLHKKSVIVFDPTAQWTGFLRKCEDKTMLKRYKYFDMKIKDSRGFNGSIKTIRDPYELIDLKKYMNRPGEITIFNISHLTPKEIDIIVASTIEQVFKSEPEESRELKTLIVYDEVHRLLPKFGGTGEGFIQLERGAREFRKWGIGLVLISQVLSDFVGEIKANIGTEIQMGTRYEGDLERVNMKYGEDVLKSVVKEPIGTGMVVNADYNNGRPYFVAFRPILHNTRRMTNVELRKYEKYFDEVEDLEYQIAYLKKLNVDVLDLELEMKLTKDKIKQGQFSMADMYLESLRPKIEEHWRKLRRKPVHLVRKKITKKEIIVGIEKAKKEREKYIKKFSQETLSFEQELKDLKKEIEEKKSKGKKTSKLELKLTDLENRLKPFKGKIKEKDAAGIKDEIALIKKEVRKL